MYIKQYVEVGGIVYAESGYEPDFQEDESPTIDEPDWDSIILQEF